VRVTRAPREELRAIGGRNVVLYVIRGGFRIGGDECAEHSLVELEREGDAIDILAETDSMLILGRAEPIGERVVAHGPFVMNTRMEIAEAIADYRAGRFGSRSAGSATFMTLA
jgi:hypothetical protein